MTASVPQIPKIVIFSLGTTDFSQDVLSVKVVPTPGDVQKVVTLDGVTHQDVGPEAWALEIEAVQDWDSARPGLAYYLFANKGTSVAFVLKNELGAESASLPKMTGSCRLVPIGYGGEGNVYATSTVTLPIDGTPVRDATP